MTTVRKSTSSNKKARIVAFSSSLGWMAIRSLDTCLTRATCGRQSLDTAVAAMEDDDPNVCRPNPFESRIIKRLQAFADGKRDDFLDVELDLDHLTTFARRVIGQCRKIKFGSVLTYGQLASKAKSPNAARAVGSVMRKNRFPLIVPCHRVVGAGGSLGGYSAPDGLDMKRRLLQMEGSL